MSDVLFGSRIRALRTERGLTQDALAQRLGFKDRQTVSAIENGERRLSAEELVRAAQVLGMPLETFTDPLLLIGEGRFSWRQTGVSAQSLTEYERNAGRWIAAYRMLSRQQGRQLPPDRRSLRLARTSSYEEAMDAGERIAASYDLGCVPARRLSAVMQDVLGILVLMVDAIPDVSGAACRLPDLDTVLINRQESEGRRHYDLAHELFHILTWDAMPPAHIEETDERGPDRVEQLANSFASALLMPDVALAPFGTWSNLKDEALVQKLNQTADALGVTASALKWRLAATNRLTLKAARAVDDALLRHNGHAHLAKHATKVFHRRSSTVAQGDILVQKPTSPAVDLKPPLFSTPFLAVIARALREGQISLRRVAHLLDLSIDDLPDLFAAHGIAAEVGV